MNTSSSKKTESNPRLQPSLWDAAVILPILALAALLFFSFLPQRTDGALLCTVSQDGAVLDVFSLTEDSPTEHRTYGEYSILIEDGSVSIAHAPCDNQDCVRTGRIHLANQSIVCLPGRFIVELSGEETPDLPAIDGVVS